VNVSFGTIKVHKTLIHSGLRFEFGNSSPSLGVGRLPFEGHGEAEGQREQEIARFAGLKAVSSP
jgi:hypothetical protein